MEGETEMAGGNQWRRAAAYAARRVVKTRAATMRRTRRACRGGDGRSPRDVVGDVGVEPLGRELDPWCRFREAACV